MIQQFALVLWRLFSVEYLHNSNVYNLKINVSEIRNIETDALIYIFFVIFENESFPCIFRHRNLLIFVLLTNFNHALWKKHVVSHSGKIWNFRDNTLRKWLGIHLRFTCTPTFCLQMTLLDENTLWKICFKACFVIICSLRIFCGRSLFAIVLCTKTNLC